MTCERNKISHWFKANKWSLNLTKKIFHISPSLKKKKKKKKRKEKIFKRITTLLENGYYCHWKRKCYKISSCTYWRKPLVEKHINDVTTKISKSIGILCKFRRIVQQPLLKQLYFSFIHCYLNYTNYAWASTYKTKLGVLYQHQKYTARIINFKNRFTFDQPLLHDMCIKMKSGEFMG